MNQLTSVKAMTFGPGFLTVDACYDFPSGVVLSKIFLLPGRYVSSHSAKISAFGTAIAEPFLPMAETGFSGVFLTLALLVFLGVIFAAQRFLPRLGQRLQSMGNLQSLGVLTLTPQCSVAMIRAGQETLVLGLTPQAIMLLTKTHDLDVVTAGRTDETSTSTTLPSKETGVAL